MRGGTSKCLFFHEKDLPVDRAERDRLLLAIMGSPDPRQIDGLGGSYSTTSKVCIIGRPPEGMDADVTYTFAQVSVTAPIVDYGGNCGNCSSAVGPFAVEEGLVEAKEPSTTVRVYNTNTDKILRLDVAVKDGRYDPEGSVRISGVPNPASRIVVWFDDPAGAVTGTLLPTGHARDVIDVPELGQVAISIVDAANPVAFVRGEALGVTGRESPAELDASADFSRRIEAIRSIAAEMCHIVDDRRDATRKSPGIPKVAFVMPPGDYQDLSGRTIPAADMDLLGRIMSMQTCNRAYALTGAVATCAAAFIPGTVVSDIVTDGARKARRIRIGHPSGALEMSADIEMLEGSVAVRSIGSVRTARRLMDGYVHVTESVLSQLAPP